MSAPGFKVLVEVDFSTWQGSADPREPEGIVFLSIVIQNVYWYDFVFLIRCFTGVTFQGGNGG